MHNMKPETIKVCLILNKVSAAEIARKFGVTRSAVHQVIHGKTKSLRLANEIARVIKKPVNSIWPGVYKKNN